MYCIEVPEGINNIMSLFYYLGIWHRGDNATVRESRVKLFYYIYYLLFPLSALVATMKSDERDEKIFLAELTIALAVLSMKLFYIIWKQDQIIEILTRIGVYVIDNHQEFTLVNQKLKRFMKFVMVLVLILALTEVFAGVAIPIFGEEKKLFFNIAFPLDWKNNDIAYLMANVFLFSGMNISLIVILFSVMIWYLMLKCALRYEILGCQIRNVGTTDETVKKRNMLQVEKENLFLRDSLATIDSHQHIRESIQQLESFLGNVFFIQIITSGLCICGSTYCLAFDVGENLLERLIHLATLFYYVSDIFMIMYFGNEIKLSSDRLSYCLFESNWYNQTQNKQKCVIVFGELLKQPHELVIGTLYPIH